MQHTHSSKRPLWYRRRGFLWSVGIIGVVLLGVLLWFRLSPWPGAMIIRFVFTNSGRDVTKALAAHQPQRPIDQILDQQYHMGDKDAWLDVYFPKEAATKQQRLPVIVWTHGGAWLSGDKRDYAAYFRLLADQGFTVVAPNYSLAPQKSYPTPVHQLNEVYSYIQNQADRFHADTNTFILAGDSAGAQLSGQMAALITNPAYAQQVGIMPQLQAVQLKGVVLNCGIYMMERLAAGGPNLPKIIGWGDDVSVWAYSGTSDFSSPIIKQMSPYYHVTKDFPATYISGGNGDPLTNTQSVPLANKLSGLGVPVTRHFFAADYYPMLPHEYQFNLDTPDGERALQATIAFLQQFKKK